MVRFVVVALLLSSCLLAVTSEGQSTQQPPDTSMRFDPVTGGPLAPASTPVFHPDTGELIPAQPAPAVTTPPTVGTTKFTQQGITALARGDARRYHKGRAWLTGGGLLGAVTMFCCGLAGINYPFPGIIIGAGVGALIVPVAVSYAPVTVPAFEQLPEASLAQLELYRQTYIAESRRLRANDVVIGELVLGALEGVYVLYLFYFTPWPYS